MIDVAIALEEQVAALDLGAAEEQRAVVGALQLQVGARDHAGEVVLDPQAARRVDLRCRSAAATSAGAGAAGAASAPIRRPSG